MSRTSATAEISAITALIMSDATRISMSSIRFQELTL